MTVLVAGMAVGGLVAPVVADAAPAPRTVRVSDSPLGEPDNISGNSARSAISAHGGVVAFDSVATNLVSGDTNRLNDVFARDRATGVLERVSVGVGGRQANGDSTRPAISGDGRLVAFESDATNLVPGDTNSRTDIFVHDRLTGTTEKLSQAADGSQANGPSLTPAISDDGRYVAFASDATNLVATPVAEATRNVYVVDRQTDAVDLVSVRVDGTAAIDASVPVLSADGRYVAFGSFDSALVPGDTNEISDLFRFDRTTRATIRVDVDSSGRQTTDGSSLTPAISADGQTIAYASDATTLVPGDTNNATDVFVYNVPNALTERVSIGPGGVQGNDPSAGISLRGGLLFGPDISADGRYVAFDSIASNLVVGDTNTCSFVSGGAFTEPGQCPDVFVRDRQRGVTVRLSVNSNGVQANDASSEPAISADGRSVAYLSTASNLAVGDTGTCDPPLFTGHPGQCPDIYLSAR